MFKIKGVKPYYEDENFSLYLVDSIELLKKISKDKFDMVFADPPYNLSNGGFTCQAGRRVSVNKGKWDKSKGLEKDFEFHSSWIKECRRVLKLSGTT